MRSGDANADARMASRIVGAVVVVVGLATGLSVLSGDYFAYAFAGCAVALLVAVAAPGWIIELSMNSRSSRPSVVRRVAARLATWNAWSWLAVALAYEFRTTNEIPRPTEHLAVLAVGVAFVVLATVLRASALARLAAPSHAAIVAALAFTAWCVVRVQLADLVFILPLASWVGLVVIAIWTWSARSRNAETNAGSASIPASWRRWLPTIVTAGWAGFILVDPQSFTRVRWIAALIGAVAVSIAWSVARFRSETPETRP